jgi:antitoxin CptB
MTLAMTEPAPPALDVRRRRLLYRATHRGTYENDLLIGGYVRHAIATMTDGEMDALEAVMELPDTDLTNWLTGRAPIPPEHDCPTLHAIRAFARQPRGR